MTPEPSGSRNLKDVIEKTGYKALNIEKKTRLTKTSFAKKKEIRTLWIKFAASAFFRHSFCTLRWGR